MRLLARDGWTVGELKLTFQLMKKKSVKHHVLGDCAHGHGVTPLRDWNGQDPPKRPPARNRI